MCDIACWCHVLKVDKGGSYTKDIAYAIYIYYINE